LPIPIASLELKNFEMLMNTTSNDFLNVYILVFVFSNKQNQKSKSARMNET
jgi:hypothetical protein